MTNVLEGKVALVAGATRGAGRGIAGSLAEAGATVWCTGRSTRSDAARVSGSRADQATSTAPSNPFDLARRPETIEETAELLALALSADLSSHGACGVTSIALTPGFLRSEAVLDHFGVTEATWRDAIAKDPYFAESETPYFVGRAVVALAADSNVHGKTGRALSSWQLAKEYGFSDVDGRRPDWCTYFDRCIAQILERGGPQGADERALVFARYLQHGLDPRQLDFLRELAASLGLPEPHPYAN